MKKIVLTVLAVATLTACDSFNHADNQGKVIHVVEEMPKPIRQLSLQGEFLFDFNSANLSNQGKKELAKLLNFLSVGIKQGNQYSGIRIVGYTDPLGSEVYNQNLSERRAQSVAAYLAEHGVPRHAISAIGAGESNQVKTCDAHKDKKVSVQLKECLRENRRVNITVY